MKIELPGATVTITVDTQAPANQSGGSCTNGTGGGK